ncbi:ATG4 [[Candida] subhashii]|uniref:Cysteine protease n=1 Tax=[Candida] subhashii TaxID=561895 RepID=A0A8J5QN75_9ASCO|nr:ATG4 [[Candida] subhashii]KAG7663465.1 ATG4 [[Candida] subhashii]
MDTNTNDPEPQTTDQNQNGIDTIIGRNLERFSAFFREFSTGTTTTGEGIIIDTKAQQQPEEDKRIFILGQEFQNAQDADTFISSQVWLSYRCGFDPIVKAEDGPSPISFFPSIVFNKGIFANFANLRSLLDKENFNSDAGWGCMIRTSQNLLATALIRLATTTADIDKDVIGLFQDKKDAPFSLHNFIRVAGESPLQIKPGQWFGPNAASLSIKKLIDEIKDNQNGNIKYPNVFISENSDLYDDELKQLFKNGTDNSSVLVLLPMRLGIEQVNEYYYESILQLLRCKYSVGISGGKPSSSFYFLGYQNQSQLIYFDPHVSQLFEDPINYQSYHTKNHQYLDINALDPSMMIGILLKDEQEYRDFKIYCRENGNKIVYFHPQMTPIQDGTVGQSWEVVDQPDDDFVNLNLMKSNQDEDEEEDEFVDLG